MSTNHIGHKFSFTTSFSEAVVPVGTVYRKNGVKYVFAYNAGADSTAAGDVVSIYDSSGTTFGYVSVTAATILDCSDGTTTRAFVAGIAGCVAATATYLWLWCGGYGTHAITTDTNVDAGEGLICADGAKLATPNSAAATAHWMEFGRALAADSSSTLSKAVLQGPGLFDWPDL